MSTPIGVECTFSPEGLIRVHRVQIGRHWQPIEQGRQWLDQRGRHILIMLPGQQPRHITLRPDTLTWELQTSQSPTQIV